MVSATTDLVSLDRFALQQEPLLEPFEEHVRQRFAAWLEKMRDYISAGGSVEREHFEAAGELGPIYRAFGERPCPLMEELNLTLAA